jgi:hypothetical protein
MTNSVPLNSGELYMRSNGAGVVGGLEGVGGSDLNIYNRTSETQKKDLPFMDTIDSNGRSTMILNYH